ncbi:MAG: hypothetical protein H7338_02170 [Candidatus Sericytochromatia bacterium]|nr:hypothetical protein [Candidatus Sericytochromatia bacterium]
MIKFVALILLVAGGCQDPGARLALSVPPGSSPQSPASTGTVTPSGSAGTPATPASVPASPAADTASTLYDGGDYEISLPAGWAFNVKDQAITPTWSMRLGYSFGAKDGKGIYDALFLIHSGTAFGTSVAEAISKGKQTSQSSGHPIIQEYMDTTGQPWGYSTNQFTSVKGQVTDVFVRGNGSKLFTLTIMRKADSAFTEANALKLANSLRIK